MNFKAVLCFYTTVPVFCLALYLHAFFPLKASLSGYAENKSVPFNNKTLAQSLPVFDKLVIVLIDALRSDFVFEKKGMVKVERIIADGRGVAFEAKAHPPTVTLPRIKAITSGTIPGFIDVVLNFDSSSLEEDNLVSQMRRAGKRLVFYGDDTWLKLFPDHFVRSDGTTSFFVSDYTEVDFNVSRHLEAELSTLDWDTMILHYLGLDHIGHLEGPHSPLVAPKLHEMDDIILQIYKALQQQSSRSLILVCGDHGMSDHGGHGGASESEVLVPAVFISPQFKHRVSRKMKRMPLQIDLAPTLSVLMGLPIPNNNLGQVLQGVLEAGGVPVESILELLYFNTLQVVRLMEANVPGYKYETSYEMFIDVTRLHREFLNQEDSVNVRQLLYLYETMLDSMTARISSSLTNYDMYQLMVAPAIMFLVLLAVLLVIVKVDISLPQDFPIGKQPFVLCGFTSLVYIVWHVIACSSNTFHSKALCGWSLGSVLTHIVLLLMLQASVTCLRALLQMNTKPSTQWQLDTSLTKLLLVGSVLHSLTYVSSSNIEEEHQTCYFLITTFFSFNAVRIFILYLNHYWQLKYPASPVASVTSRAHSEDGSQGKSFEYDNMNYDSFKDKTLENRHITQLEQDKIDASSYKDLFTHDNEKVTNFPDHQGRNDASKEKSIAIKLNFPTRELVSLLVIIVILRFLRSLNQTGNKWLDRPDIGDWLGRLENRGVLTIAVVAALILLLLVLSKKYSSTEVMLTGIALLSCYRYRAKAGAVYDVLNEIKVVDKKYKNTIQYLVVCGVGLLLNFRCALDMIFYKCYGKKDEKTRATIIVGIIESVQQSLLLLMCILLRTHNTLYVVGLALVERLIEDLVPSIVSLPVPYLTMFCLWMGRASFFYQGNSNSLSTVDVAAGYVGLPEYQAIIVTIQLFIATYAGPIFWFIVLLKYIYLRSLRCDTVKESLTARLKTGAAVSVLTLVLERLFTLLIYTTVTTSERYHLFVWTVFSPKLLYEGVSTLLFAMVSLVYLFHQ